MLIQHQASLLLRFILVLVSVFFGTGLVNHVLAAPEKSSQIPIANPALQLAFPTTGVLDNFDRVNGVIGTNWNGSYQGYAIASNHMEVNSGGDIYWGPDYFGVDQEAYVTLTTIDTEADEVSLELKAQSRSSIEPGQIGVVYNPQGNSIQVWTYSTAQGWVEQGAPIAASYTDGDIFGARALADGQVEVYKNSSLLGVRSLTSWPYYANGGYIGLFHLDAEGTVLDDFGGGTMSGSPTLTPTPVPCSDPLSCNPVNAIPAIWRCNIEECTGPDWFGAVIAWPSWSAYQSNGRTGNNSRSVYSSGNQPLYPYMGSWADGCEVTAVTGVTLIIEWQRGTDTYRQTFLDPGQSHTIDLISPEDGALIEAMDGFTEFSVSLANCNPQNIFGPTSTPSSTPTATFTPTDTPTPTFTPSSTTTLTLTPTPTFTPSNTSTATFTSTTTPTATASALPSQAPPATPAKATLISPSGAITNTQPTFRWNEVSSNDQGGAATWYYLWINGPLGNVFKQWYSTAQASCDGSTCSVTPFGLTLSGSNYTWWVQTWNDARYGPWSDPMSFAPVSPGKATLTSPTGSIATNTPAYTWNAVSGATWYYLWVDGLSGNVLKQWYQASAICSGSTCSVANTTPNLVAGSHTWKVQTWNNVGYGPWSDAMSFSPTLPGKAALVSPSGSIATNTPAYTWNAVSEATWYYLWVSQMNADGSFTTIHSKWYEATQVCSGGSCSLTPVGVTLSAGNYRWWVQTWNNVGYGPWSDGMNFSTP